MLRIIRRVGVAADDSAAGGNKLETDPSTNLLPTTVRKFVDEIKSAGPAIYVYCERYRCPRGNISCNWYV